MKKHLSPNKTSSVPSNRYSSLTIVSFSNNSDAYGNCNLKNETLFVKYEFCEWLNVFSVSNGAKRKLRHFPLEAWKIAIGSGLTFC